jgi:arabinofuranan 3-O-arabinosyltransferase
VALVAGGMWRTALAAAATVAAMVAASVAAFGVEPWLAWVRAMPEFVAIVDGERAHLAHLIPTARSDALTLGASERVAALVQAPVTAGAAVAVWIAFRRGSGALAVAALAVASVVAAPYAFIYDLTLVAAAIALIAAERLKVLSAPELIGLTAVLLLPVGMLLHLVPPIATVVHAAALAWIVLRLRAETALPAERST